MTAADGRTTAAAKNPARANWLWTAAAAAILLTAHLLPPDPRGFGTHVRVLPLPCPFHALTGLPCPGCGLTTAFCLAARGRWTDAAAAHYLGPAGYVATWVVLFWSILGTLGFTKGPARYIDRPGVLWVLAALMLGAWIVRLAVVLGAV